MFHEWARALHPFWSKAKIEKEAEVFANAYSECRQAQKEASASNEVYKEYAEDVMVLFIPVVCWPFINTFFYWCRTSLRERILTKDDLDVSGSDMLDSDALFDYLKQLEPEVRKAGYKNIGLHSVLQKRIEKTIVEDDLSQFEDILLTHSSETDMLCRFFGRMSNRVPNPGFMMDMVTNPKKAYSSHYLNAVREFGRSVRHLPKEEKKTAYAKYAYESVGELVLKYFGVRDEMTPGEIEIFEGMLNNPIFPIFTEGCHEMEKEWLKENQGDGQVLEVPAKTADSESQPNPRPQETQMPTEEMGKAREKDWIPSDYQWPDRSFFVKDERFVKAPKSITLIDEIADFAASDEKYEKFQRFMEKVAVIGKIAKIPDLEALIQYFTGRKMDNAAEKITWSGANHGARYLVYIVQKVAKGKNKYDVLKFKSLVSFTDISGDDEVAIQKNPKNIAGIVQGFKNMDPDILLPLTGEDSYDCFSELNQFKTKTAD